jgi:T5SS/PEP-CTERM-associated repeat protein
MNPSAMTTDRRRANLAACAPAAARFRSREAGLRLCLLAGLAWQVPAWAVDYHWVNAAGGPFRTAVFWQPYDPLLPPPLFLGPGGAADTANFNLGVTPQSRYTVTDVNGENDRLLIGNDSLRLEITGYTLLNDDAAVANLAVGIAAGDTGDLVLAGSGGATLQTHDTYIGEAAGSTGIVTVTGSQWQWNCGQELEIGFGGTGTLTIENGGNVTGCTVGIATFSSSAGTLTVRGAGSSLTGSSTTLGSSGAATLLIEDGGNMTSTQTVVGNGILGSGAATVTGSGSSWTIGGTLFLAYGGTAALTIRDGASVSNPSINQHVWMGGWADEGFGDATAMVTGAGSTWTIGGDLNVGVSGTGTLTIEDGGFVSNATGWIGRNATATGTVVVTGAGSNWIQTGDLFVGNDGSGHLIAEAGGTVSNATGWIGASAGSTGTVTVRGAGTSWTNDGELFIGSFGSGQLTIEVGGAVFNNGTWIGTSPGSSGTAIVSGTGSTWSSNGQFIVGYRATGAMTVEAGGSALNDGDSFIGYTLLAGSMVTVTGPGSTWTNSGSLIVGHSGSGMLVVAAGGAVSNLDGVIGNNDGSSGLATVADTGSLWTNRGTLLVGSMGVGTLNVHDGGVVSAAAGLTIGPQGLVTGNGTIVADVTNAGAVGPGNSPGTLTIDGSYLQSALGTLNIELEDLGHVDLLVVSGNATLSGALALSCFAACSFAVGDEFVILDAGGTLLGSFAGEPALSGFATGKFAVAYDRPNGQVWLRVTESVTAVPEPQTCALMLAGLLAVGAAVQARRHA